MCYNETILERMFCVNPVGALGVQRETPEWGGFMQPAKPIMAVSVRELAEYAHRSGSIESGFRTAASMAEGTRIHKEIQEEYREPDRREVPMAGELSLGDAVFRLEGRCDGLRFEGEWAVVEEIKSTSTPLSWLEQGQAVHWAQALCYAVLYALQEKRGAMRVRLLYVHSVTGERKSFEREETLEALQSHVEDLLACYAPYAQLKAAHREQRGRSCRELGFPFGAYRPGQRHLAGAVYKSIAEGRKLFARAPTGTGKTVSTLFPAVKAIGEGHLERVLYVTARTTTRQAAEAALQLMEQKGLVLRRVTLTAKEKICFQEEVRCSKEACPYADGYYDRINGALLDLLGHECAISRETVERYARKHLVCPFELSLDAAYEADTIIGDYNYVFDPGVALKRLWEEDKRRTAVLVDEAHNLADRAREMYSAELPKAAFLGLQRLYKAANPGLSQAAKDVNAWMIRLRKEQAERRQPVLEAPPQELPGLLEAFCLQAERELTAAPAATGGGSGARPGAPDDEGADAVAPAQLLADTYYAAQSYIRASGWADDRFAAYTRDDRDGFALRLYCLDPSALLRQAGKSYRSLILFSATLSPLGFYRESLGGGEEDYSLTVPSPFRKEQLQVLLSPLSVRYRDREASVAPLSALLHEQLQRHRGNTMVFFSSYEYMRKVQEHFMEKPCGFRVLVQHGGMTEEERDAFLRAFQANTHDTADMNRDAPVVGFAVLGGIFSEGIDLTGDRLTAVVVVGTGIPQLGLERDLIRDYYDRTGRNGYHFAYVYPGVGKVLQAGGRLIRTDTDQGILLLVDDRFSTPFYQELMPEEWRPMRLLPDRRQAARQRWMRLYEPLSAAKPTDPTDPTEATDLTDSLDPSEA